jgi:hypothetical protein
MSAKPARTASLVLRGATAVHRLWTTEDLERVRELYPVHGVAETAKALGRTRRAVFRRASLLGLQRRPFWTPSEDRRLALLWDTDLSLRQIARELGRLETATYLRAEKLGLPSVPEGCEYLTAAVDRVGYSSTWQLRSVLAWAGVRVYPVRAPRARGVKARQYVDPCEVDEAMTRWHETEPLERAAERHGVCGLTMRRWLGVAGIVEAERVRKRHWRVKSTDADRAMALRADPSVAKHHVWPGRAMQGDRTMRERPILFSAPMARALLDGRKTQTRRIVAADDVPAGVTWVERDGVWGPCRDELCRGALDLVATTRRCPYGVPDDRLWVRETWAPADYLNGSKREEPQQVAYRSTSTILDHGHMSPEQYPLDTYGIDFDKIKWKPSIFMPRWASRVTLEITDVRVERLQEITEEDARAEGVRPALPLIEDAHRVDFRALWEGINGDRAPWSSNPWVWALSFRRVA